MDTDTPFDDDSSDPIRAYDEAVIALKKAGINAVIIRADRLPLCHNRDDFIREMREIVPMENHQPLPPKTAQWKREKNRFSGRK